MTSTEPGGPQDSQDDAAPEPGPIRPGPIRPGPGSIRPGPGSIRPKPGSIRPGAAAAAKAATVTTVAASDPHRFGRVDPDGTIWLITTSGARNIGSWQAGDAEAAYQHFGRRFDDLHTEVLLLEQRLASGLGDARKIRAAASALTENLPTAQVLGDIDALAARLQTIVEHADSACAAEKAKRDEARTEQTARKEALAVKAEELAAGSEQWKSAGDQLRAILDEWKTITGLDRKTDDALWKRYSAARETFNRRRGSHFAELDRERVGARQAKEALCVRAEELCDSTDWGPTASTFRGLLTEWKAAGRAAKDVDDKLWHRFKSAQDKFFSARSASNAERDTEFRANAEAKAALLAKAEKLDASDMDAARAALRVIADKWDSIGKVPRERGADLDRRLRAVEKKIRDTPTGGVDPEAQARADQFRSRAEQFARQAEKAATAGRTKDAEQARANAEQWSKWADAAAASLSKKR